MPLGSDAVKKTNQLCACFTVGAGVGAVSIVGAVRVWADCAHSVQVGRPETSNRAQGLGQGHLQSSPWQLGIRLASFTTTATACSAGRPTAVATSHPSGQGEHRCSVFVVTALKQSQAIVEEVKDVVVEASHGEGVQDRVCQAVEWIDQHEEDFRAGGVDERTTMQRCQPNDGDGKPTKEADDDERSDVTRQEQVGLADVLPTAHGEENVGVDAENDEENEAVAGQEECQVGDTAVVVSFERHTHRHFGVITNPKERECSDSARVDPAATDGNYDGAAPNFVVVVAEDEEVEALQRDEKQHDNGELRAEEGKKAGRFAGAACLPLDGRLGIVSLGDLIDGSQHAEIDGDAQIANGHVSQQNAMDVPDTWTEDCHQQNKKVCEESDEEDQPHHDTQPQPAHQILAGVERRRLWSTQKLGRRVGCHVLHRRGVINA